MGYCKKLYTRGIKTTYIQNSKPQTNKTQNRSVPKQNKPNYKSIYTHPDIIKYFAQKNLTTLAFYYKLKQHYKNSVIKQWNPNKIGKRCKVSHYMASKYSKLLIKEGLACWETGRKGTHLRLKSMKEILFITDDSYKKGWVEIPITYKNRINEIKDLLRNVVTYKLVKNQQYLINLKKDNLRLNQDENCDDYDRVKKILKIRKENPDFLDHSLLSDSIVGMRRLGETIGLSHSGASRFLDRLRKKGKITTKISFRLVKNVGLIKPEEFTEKFKDYPGWFYRTKMGNIGVIFGTQIQYLSPSPTTLTN